MSRRPSFLRFSVLAAVSLSLVFAQAPQSQPPAQSGPATLVVNGDIATPLTLKAEDLAAMPREKASIPEQDGTEVEYEGVPLREVLKRAGAPLGGQLRGKALASYLLAKAHDGYQVVFTLAEIDAQFANEQIIVADKRDGKPLFGYQGPFRLVCPHDKAGARSVRMLETLEIVRLQK
ncbi:MAG: molybdopterin-dependent oxidoreductase [Bryobacteraceae bacterium]|jgi:DMSO/TMAO reductase YedYZ molybdopterin-dependent catalytic subunit